MDEPRRASASSADFFSLIGQRREKWLKPSHNNEEKSERTNSPSCILPRKAGSRLPLISPFSLVHRWTPIPGMRVAATAAAGRSTALASTSAAPRSSSSVSLLLHRGRCRPSTRLLRASASPPTSAPAPSSDLSEAAIEERSKIQKMLDRLVFLGRE